MEAVVYFHTGYKKMPKESESLALLSARDFLQKSDVKIEKDEFGRPYICSENAFIGISHSESLFAAVLSYTPVAIDCEKKREIKRNCEIAKRYFSPDDAQSVIDGRADFLKLWTRYEALVKLDGRGLSKIREAAKTPAHYFELDDALNEKMKEDFFISLVSKEPLGSVRIKFL